MAYLELQYLSTKITRFTTIQAFLPTDAMSGKVFEPPFKTLYFLPGFSNDATTLITYLGLRRECELKGIAVVVVNGDNAFYMDHPECLSNYSAFVKETVDMTRKLLPLSQKREDTFIGGISMGGYGALLNGLKFNDYFSKIAALSPSADCYDLICGHPAMFPQALFTNVFKSKEHYYENDTNLCQYYANVDRNKIPELFIACGEQDDLVGKGVEDFRQKLTELKIPFVDRRGKGNHEMAYWEDQMDPLFSFLAGIEPGTKTKLILDIK